jgi:hypothetical protein
MVDEVDAHWKNQHFTLAPEDHTEAPVKKDDTEAETYGHWALRHISSSLMILFFPLMIILTQFSTIVTKVLSYILYCIFCVFSNAFETADDFVPPNYYIPKSKRWKWLRQMTAVLKRQTQKWGRQLDCNIQNWETKKRILRVERAVRRSSTFRSVGRKRTLVAFLAVAMEASQQQTNYVRFDADSGPVGIDNRCTACISHVKSDFVGPLKEISRAIKGFGGTRTTGVQEGTLRWEWNDDHGVTHEFIIPGSFYVPQGEMRLLSPQHLSQTQKDKTGTGESTNGVETILYWDGKSSNLHIPLGKRDNVSTFQLAPGYKAFSAFCEEANIEDSDDNSPVIIAEPMLVEDDDDEAVPDNSPLRPRRSFKKQGPTETLDFELNGPQSEEGNQDVNIIVDEEDRLEENKSAELLKIHQSMGHLSFAKLQVMAQRGVFPKKYAKCAIPACSACLYSKATRRQWRHRNSNNKDEAVTPIEPGDVVSVDQLISPTPGLIAQMTGIPTRERYNVATVYVDQASRLGYVYLQKGATTEETLLGKEAFERYAVSNGVTIKTYHADNGIFKSAGWVKAVWAKGQSLTFAGVNAHHQNGLAERRIRELQDSARTMLIHANRRWPSAVNAYLWPYAVRMANEVYNHAPSMQDEERRSPIQIFSSTAVDMNPKHFKTFGCPAYVLDAAIQGGAKGGKWTDRARLGIYIGLSPIHSKRVALVLSITTGNVSPQFHVELDPGFQTVRDEKGTTEAAMWMTKCGFGFLPKKPARQGKKQPTKYPLGASAGSSIPRREGAKRVRLSTSSSNKRQRSDEQPMKAPEGAVAEPTHAPEGAETEPQSQEQDTGPDQQDQQLQHLEIPSPVLEHNQEADRSNPTVQQPEVAASRRSGRHRQPVERLITAMTTEIVKATSHDKDANGKKTHCIPGEIFCLQALYPNPGEDDQHPLTAYKATADPDTMYMHEAMRQSDKGEFVRAMAKEVDDQSNNENFTLMKRSKVPKGKTILPTVWQMRRKRDIKTQKIKKYKARLNVDGSRMIKGQHYDQTYAPVATWNSIRMLLTMTAVHGWYTKQLDYVLAFPQAPVEKELYIEVPRGFVIEEGEDPKEYVLKLHRNVYGQKQAGRVWYQHLRKKLIDEVGFTPSAVDDCVFYRGKTMYVLYTDDSILAGPDEKEINTIIEDLKKAKLDITIEGDLEDFLGINIDRKEDGTIHLTQPHLIDNILNDLNFQENTKSKPTPAKSSQLLSRHSNSEPHDESFNYRSLIGKLGYLEKGSRSDIAYIVHQCARFSIDPKMEHTEALRWLGRYLKGTKDKGTILKPVKGQDLQMFVDADFAGNWDPEESLDRDTARSRYGYIIMYQGCPIVWKSCMMTELALSSTESEYTGLSYALREAIPIMQILQEMKAFGFPVESTKPKVHCRVFEDNSGALQMATIHKHRARTKHLNVKLHFFRDFVTRGDVSIHAVGTDNQRADYLTKAVNEEILVRHRKVIMGW